ncbi:hypothetical protein PLICRDRAFT_35544 [Plicaturopsis crispa FD-325 SS-3]|nr:hypothetical protein PLICRDRAFT_35544 [Plicaturopsis crispa FD-325 SS-3]
MLSFLHAFITASVLSLPFSNVPLTAAKSVTIDDKDPSLTFTPGWRLVSSSSATGGTFAAVDELEGAVDASLPNGATAVSYVGFKQSKGAMYGACIDCEVGRQSSFISIDAHDPTTDDEQLPTTLFTFTDLDPTISHSLTVFNLPDPRFDETGQLTFDSLVVDLSEDDSPNSSASFTLLSSSTTGSSPTTIQSTPSPTTTVSTTSQLSSVSPTSSALDPSISPITTGGSIEPTAGPSLSGSGSASPTSSFTTISSETTAPGSLPQTSSTLPSNFLQPSASSANSGSPSSAHTLSTSLIAVIAMLSFIAVLTLIFGAFVFTRMSRRRAQLAGSRRIPDPESGVKSGTQTAPNMRQVGGLRTTSASPARPRNPFMDEVPATVPLDAPPLNVEERFPRPRLDSTGSQTAWLNRTLR